MSFLIDTNVLCEKLKPKPDAKVLEWLEENESHLFVSVLTIAEIKRGIEALPEGKRRTSFEEWLIQTSSVMKGSILSVNRSVAHVWGQLQGNLDKQGTPLPPFDSILAATAIRYSLTVVTRNTKGFQNAPVHVINPFL